MKDIAATTWLKPQGVEQAEVLLRQVWQVVAKLTIDCIKQPDLAMSGAAGLRFVADVGLSSMRGQQHGCGAACPEQLRSEDFTGVGARVSALLQMLGVHHLTGPTLLKGIEWSNRLVYTPTESNLVERACQLLEDAATRLDAGFAAPWDKSTTGLSVVTGVSSNMSNCHAPNAQQNAANAEAPRDQAAGDKPHTLTLVSKRRASDTPVRKHTSKMEALLSEAALAFTLAYCELDADSWNEDVQNTEDQSARIQQLQQLLDASIECQPEGATMSIEQIHAAWDSHVHKLPQHSPFVDLKLGRVACATLPLIGKDGGETAMQEVPSVMNDVPTEPECGQLFPAFFQTRMVQACVSGFLVRWPCNLRTSDMAVCR